MSLDKDFVLAGLLQHNFFLAQKRTKEEMPPVFGSGTFTPDVAKRIVAGKPRKVSEYQGYDTVSYKLTRFNGIPRTCSIPHPAAYSHLALCIHDNWHNLDYITKNNNSLVRPRAHKDGRVMIMDYEQTVEKTRRHLISSFERRVMVTTDIANFFPSMYSHAVPWAAVGFGHSKKHKSLKYKSEWFNQLDQKLRLLNRNETHGVAIGPATSNVVSEVILARVDETLRQDFEFVRFIDDYTAYCRTEVDAEEFVRKLSKELAKYKLMLNIGKTKFVSLPQAISEEWVTELALVLPANGEVSRYHAASYLNLAVGLAKEVPDGSVVKYAAKALIRQKLGFMAKVDVLRYILTLSVYQPTLLPLLKNLFDDTMLLGIFRYGEELAHLAKENARFRRSDGMAWTLYYLNKYSVAIGDDLAKEVLASCDCVALLLLYLSGDASHQASVVKFAKDLDATDLYELDQYWLLLYELFRGGAIKNPYKGDDAFKILKDSGVSFVETTA